MFALQPYIDMDDFQPAAIARVSGACTAICLWVRSMYKYYNVLKVVEPKRRTAADATRAFNEAEAALADARLKLQAAVVNLQVLEARLEDLVEHENKLTEDISTAKFRTDNAEKLISGLSHEVASWRQKLAELQHASDRCLGDTLLSVAAMSYASGMSCGGRSRAVQHWKAALLMESIAFSDTPSPLLSAFSSEQMRDSWRLHGLPTDSLSEENAVMLFGGRPLLLEGADMADGRPHSSPRHHAAPMTTLWTKKVVSSSTIQPCVPLVTPWPLLIDPTGVASK